MIPSRNAQPVVHRWLDLARRHVTAPTARVRGARGVALLAAGSVAALTLGLVPAAQAATSGGLDLRPSEQSSTTVSGPMLDSRAIATFTVPSERKVWLGLQLRSSGATTGYRTRVRIDEDGTVLVGFSRVNGSETIIDSRSTDVHVSTGDRLYVQGMITGESPVQLSVRTWQPGKARPDWQATSTDSSDSRITSEGRALVWGYLSGAAGAPARVAFSDASSSVVSSTPTPAPSPTVTPSPSSSPEPTTSPTAPSSSTSPAPVPSTSPTTTPPAATISSRPTASNTGVPAGTTLKRHDGDIIVTKDGTVLDKMDIHGFVTVRAKNVRITNSIVRGGQAQGYATGLITNYGYAGLLIENVDVEAEHPSVYFDGIKGNNFTARRVHVVGNVDSVKIHGDIVTLENSLLENTVYYASDPQQGGGPTHNDNIQILQGSHLVIRGNTVRGATNFAILGGAEQSNVDLVATDNWLDGGWCTVKLQTKKGWSERATVSDNKFGPNRKVKSCAFTAYPEVNLTAANNVFEADGSPVPILRVVS